MSVRFGSCDYQLHCLAQCGHAGRWSRLIDANNQLASKFEYSSTATASSVLRILIPYVHCDGLVNEDAQAESNEQARLR